MDSSDPRVRPTPAVSDPAAGYAPVPPASASTAPRRTGGRPAPRPATAGRADHQVTVNRLKGVAIVATAVTVGAFAGLVVGHPIGTAASTTNPGAAGGSTATDASQNVTQADPFFDPNPGSGGNQAAPAFGPVGGGGGGGGPAFQSSGS